MYSFLAKQGQHGQIACLLSSRFNQVVHVRAYVGRRGQGQMITMEQGPNSKRTIDRFLHRNRVPGSVSRRNKYKVMNGDEFDVKWRVEYNEPFHWVENGRFKGLYQKINEPFFCGYDCCGGVDKLVKC